MGSTRMTAECAHMWAHRCAKMGSSGDFFFDFLNLGTSHLRFRKIGFFLMGSGGGAASRMCLGSTTEYVPGVNARVRRMGLIMG